jgi:hypothetical protein
VCFGLLSAVGGGQSNVFAGQSRKAQFGVGRSLHHLASSQLARAPGPVMSSFRLLFDEFRAANIFDEAEDSRFEQHA